VPPPGIAEPIGDAIEPIDPDVGCVAELDAPGVLDVFPQAVGCAFEVSDPADPASFALAPASPESEDEPGAGVEVATSGWDPLDAGLAEGGGTVRSLWQ
jgi:hypothetical protein